MSKRVTVDQPISPEEITVIRVMLERAAVTADCARLLTELNALRVVYRCSCGCDSVDFQTFDPKIPPMPIADGTGETPSGGSVGVIIWGSVDSVTGIEIYDEGAGDNDLRLPTPESIQPWGPDPKG